MLLEHIAAIFFFSGPVFYIGLIMVIDPASIACIPELLYRALQRFHLPASGNHAQLYCPGPEKQANAIRKRRCIVRRLGFVLVVFASLLGIVV